MHLYVHVPFCARRCSYCDFAIAVRREVPSASFAGLIAREWTEWQSHPAWHDAPALDTIYFGGGTPSRLDPAAIETMLSRFAADRTLAPGAEITLEANPDDVTPESAAAWRTAGVNRISLGAQSFDPAVLQWMHRTHDREQIAEAVRVLRVAGFDDLSLDLIFAVPAALERDWGADLDRALALGPTHLSFYGLTVEPVTPLGKWTARGEAVALDEERAAAEFLMADARLVSAGFEHYEVSSAALPGHRARHNSAYWRRAPFIGLGPSAHSGFAAARRWNLRNWEEYRQRAEAGERVVAEEEVLDPDQIGLEDLYLGLRTSDGIAADRVPGGELERWTEAGWARLSDSRVVLTPEGWLRLDALVASLSHC
jgi:oxygen-independent coproporphyrinogen-3 oxidase